MTIELTEQQLAEQQLKYYFNRLERAEVEIKDIRVKLKKVFDFVHSKSYNKLKYNDKLSSLCDYVRIIDNFYEETAEACRLCVQLHITPPIFLYRLVEILLSPSAVGYRHYDFLNKKLVDIGQEEFNENKQCKEIMSKFLEHYNALLEQINK